ncbi:hypothetical protein [Rarobacter incanus]|uniref:Uncharacterized protein n=1 Tax=Rarobacter incanus TaxID=153494 RepID=A0A542SS18_9MICO|nr:hypothetical protein [Rarobacter incanus]TQK77392.1 hypothetical protein FB389_2124 [Rarobacter incanus]
MHGSKVVDGILAVLAVVFFSLAIGGWFFDLEPRPIFRAAPTALFGIVMVVVVRQAIQRQRHGG